MCSSFFVGRVEVEGEIIVGVDCKLRVIVEGCRKKMQWYGDALESRSR